MVQKKPSPSEISLPFSCWRLCSSCILEAQETGSGHFQHRPSERSTEDIFLSSAWGLSILNLIASAEEGLLTSCSRGFLWMLYYSEADGSPLLLPDFTLMMAYLNYRRYVFHWWTSQEYSTMLCSALPQPSIFEAVSGAVEQLIQ